MSFYLSHNGLDTRLRPERTSKCRSTHVERGVVLVHAPAIVTRDSLTCSVTVFRKSIPRCVQVRREGRFKPLAIVGTTPGFNQIALKMLERLCVSQVDTAASGYWEVQIKMPWMSEIHIKVAAIPGYRGMAVGEKNYRAIPCQEARIR